MSIPSPHLQRKNKSSRSKAGCNQILRAYFTGSIQFRRFFSVFNDYKTALENELITSEEFRLMPGQKQKFNRTLNIDTRYVGIVAAYKDLEQSQWRASAAVPLKESAPEIYIFLEGNKIQIGAKPACGFFCQFQSPKPPPGTLYEVIE
ncbi:MAG: type VI secretion system lipoprotein TssJ [Nitrosomonas sp.]|nr:type VI secretion system lipoprotein TssJ [Nitrosomonas sp.]